MELSSASRAALVSSLLLLGSCGGGGGGGGGLAAEQVTLVRDEWGAPHVFAETDRGALFGLGWATAEDRLFQMVRSRLMAQGRVAEFFGPGFVPGGGEANVDHDRAARLSGWWRHAVRATALLDPETLGLLQAYSDGVNAYTASPSARFHPLFAQYGIPIEPWRPEDCIAVWLRFGRHFATDGSDEVARLREWEALTATLTVGEALAEMHKYSVCDEGAAVVQAHNVPAVVRQAMQDYADALGLSGGCQVPLDGPTFSQAWAVAGPRSTTGRALLGGDPRSEVYRPNKFYEWSLDGETLLVRGIGVPGSPIALSGSTPHVAWSPTALGMDQADLFSLATDPSGHPGQYWLDGSWRAFEVDELETIRVKGGADRSLRYRETVWGPVVTAVLSGTLPGEEYSVKRVPTVDPARETARALLGLYRARDVDEVLSALGEWSWPSINMVFADAGGRIGYTIAGDVPVRNPAITLAGVIPHDGSTSASDWIDRLPWGLQPHVLDPVEGELLSANHMPVGSWYPIPIRFGAGGRGDTPRSRRLRERLQALPPIVTPDEVFDVRLDVVQPCRRDLVELGVWLRDNQPGRLSPDAVAALAVLEPWWLAGAPMDDSHPGAPLAWQLDLLFREANTAEELLQTYGEGDSGLNLFLKTKIADVRAPSPVPLTPAEAGDVDSRLAGAWAAARLLGDPSGLTAWYRSEVLTFTVEAWASLEGLPPPTPVAAPLSVGPVRCADPDTLFSPPYQGHTLLAQPGAGDVARSLSPPGQSEHQGPHELDQVGLWELGEVKQAPATLAGVQASGPTLATELVYPLPGPGE